jgi:hypothetical protein
MENNLALKPFAALRKSAKGEPLTDSQVRKLTWLSQIDINIAAEELEAEGMITVQRTYMLAEE